MKRQLIIALTVVVFSYILIRSLHYSQFVYAQSSSVIKPTKLSIIYTSPQSENTGVALTPAAAAQKFQVAVWARNQGTASLPAYLTAGFTGIAVQYYILNEALSAPPTFTDVVPTASTPYCTSTEKNYQAYSSNIDSFKGDFCLIHDSIIGRLHNDAAKKFDHDLDPATPPIWADETWFVHRTDTGRRYISTGQIGKQFYANHNHPDWQAYFTARCLEQMHGSPRYPSFGMNGIYLDNLDLSWRRYTNMGSTPKEFAASSDFVQSEINFVSHLYSALHTNGNNFLLFANLTEGSDSGSDWDQFTSILDGGLQEDFLLNWGRGPYSSTIALNQFRQAEKWIGAGRHYMAVAPGNMWYSRTRFDREALYTLAGQLLVTDGTRTSFKYYNDYGDPAGSRTQYYEQFYDYPEYYYQLGLPLGPRYQYTTNPLVYKRDFACGQVSVDFTAITGTITQSTCQTSSFKQIILDYLKNSPASDLNHDGKVNIIDAFWL